jgi:hypothetical protein
MPGIYQVSLTVNGKTYTQPLEVKMDPRVKTSVKELQLQHDLALECYNARKQLLQALSLKNGANSATHVANTGGSKDADNDKTLSRLEATFASLHDLLQDSDMPPTTQAIKGVKDALNEYRTKNRLE